MDFWNDFSKAVAQAADTTVKETEKLSIVARLRYRVSTINSKIENCLRTLGEMRYSEHEGNEVSAEEYETVCSEITLLKKKLAVLEKRIAEMSDYISCPQCGYKVRKELTVCPYCGLTLREEAEAPAETADEAPAEVTETAEPAEEAKED